MASKSSPTKRDAQDFEVSRVPPELADHVFDQLAPMVARALRHGAGDSTTEAHLRAEVRTGNMAMWAVHRGAEIVACVVLSVHRYPAKTTVFIELAAGRDLGVWVERIEELLRDYRDLVGADTIEATCRDGMTRRLLRRGWRRKATVVELR